MSRTLRNAKGFTLVELAIVLVIIGIILGAVLKGQELINNAKMKRAYNDVRGVISRDVHVHGQIRPQASRG